MSASQSVFYRLTVTESGINVEVVNIALLDKTKKYYDIVAADAYESIMAAYRTAAATTADWVEYVMNLVKQNSYQTNLEYQDYVRNLKEKGVKNVPSTEEYLVITEKTVIDTLGNFTKDMNDELDNVKKVLTGLATAQAIVKKTVDNQTGIQVDIETSNRLFSLMAGVADLVTNYLDRIENVCDPITNDMSKLDLSVQIIPYRSAIMTSLSQTLADLQEVSDNFLAYGPILKVDTTSIPSIQIDTTVNVTDVLGSDANGNISVADDATLANYDVSGIVDTTVVNPAANPNNGGFTATYGTGKKP